ncbi:hypothetical protein NQ318_013814 [Aromia moschata]|uniref:DNA-directed DNA polymerase n=1 Tax=Aromia moschata TaxID=1265417 RepID=A0AAV8Z8K7_9CUCU|nr:hypothetical protein NQ318_013814 [Aromia moschata]
MINTFVKVQTAASGWRYCKTLQDQNKYIQLFKERENVELDVNKIGANPGLRSVAKLLLNSFWGKFGQTENLPKTIIINNSFELLELLTNPSIIVNTLRPAYTEHPATNVVIAKGVLGKKVLYYDTDSVIYICIFPRRQYYPHGRIFRGHDRRADRIRRRESYYSLFQEDQKIMPIKFIRRAAVVLKIGMTHFRQVIEFYWFCLKYFRLQASAKKLME